METRLRVATTRLAAGRRFRDATGVVDGSAGGVVALSLEALEATERREEAERRVAMGDFSIEARRESRRIVGRFFGVPPVGDGFASERLATIKTGDLKHELKQ